MPTQLSAATRSHPKGSTGSAQNLCRNCCRRSQAEGAPDRLEGADSYSRALAPEEGLEPTTLRLTVSPGVVHRRPGDSCTLVAS